MTWPSGKGTRDLKKSEGGKTSVTDKMKEGECKSNEKGKKEGVVATCSTQLGRQHSRKNFLPW